MSCSSFNFSCPHGACRSQSNLCWWAWSPALFWNTKSLSWNRFSSLWQSQFPLIIYLVCPFDDSGPLLVYHWWIAINVMQYHCVCRGEVDSLSPSPSRQEEHKISGFVLYLSMRPNPREAERVELDLFRQAASYLNLFSCSRLEKKTFGTKKKTNKKKITSVVSVFLH